MILLVGWLRVTLDDGLLEVEGSSSREIGGWTFGGVSGLEDPCVDLVSLLDIGGVDSISGDSFLASSPWDTLSSPLFFLRFSPSPSSSISF